MADVRRALLSCYDKTGLETFAKALTELGIELIASGGTAEFLTRHGLRVTTVEAFTGSGEQLDGRVKTLHPKIHAGILARREDAAHVEGVGPAGLIDLVIVNLYPFADTVQRNASLREALEQIDIGGVTLLRAAAKNFEHVGVVCRAEQYGEVLEALRKGGRQLPPELARKLSVDAFALTSAYDTRIAEFLTPNGEAAKMVSLNLRRHQALRYGENPHQRGDWYVPAHDPAWGLGTLQQTQGKELSYNNLVDIDAAVRCLLDVPATPACVIIKHACPCGVAIGDTVAAAYERAFGGDPESAFGGVVGLNRPVNAAVAERLTTTFLEVIVAPSVEPAAQACLAQKPNLRVVTLDWPPPTPMVGASPTAKRQEWRQLQGAWLAQTTDGSAASPPTLRVVTKRKPSPNEEQELQFAWRVVKHARSNGIVLSRDYGTVGIGQGHTSRVGAVRLAVQQAGDRARGAVAASDGFFPFPDGVSLLASAGVTAIVQPGGSKRDADVVAAADAAKMSMVVTGIRQFRH